MELWEQEKDPDDAVEYGIDFEEHIVAEAVRQCFFPAGVILRYPRDTGFYYEVTKAGKTSSYYPDALPRAEDVEVADGSCVMTCRHPASVNLAVIDGNSWSVVSGGSDLVIASERVDGMRVFATMTGGTDGLDYEILCRIHTSTGLTIDATRTLRVRSQ